MHTYVILPDYTLGYQQTSSTHRRKVLAYTVNYQHMADLKYDLLLYLIYLANLCQNVSIRFVPQNLKTQKLPGL